MNQSEGSLIRKLLFCVVVCGLSLLSLRVLAAPSIADRDSANDPCLPFVMPPTDLMFSASRRVFAHYFDIFPLSMDNKPPRADYYAQMWLVARKGNMWYPNGGFLRTRPLPLPRVSAPEHYRIRNLEQEIRLAIARGITGFTYDIGKLEEIQPNGNLQNMLKAAAAVDQRFKIILMVDHLTPRDIIAVIRAVYDDPVVYRHDGKVVVAPFMADTLEPEDWKAVKETLANDGHPIYFMPTFLSLPNDVVSKYAGVADAFGLFGTPLVDQGRFERLNAETVRKAGKPYMSGISPQGYRPKDFTFWETEGSRGYREGWMAAVEKKPNWIQLTTWNDFSETTQVSPYTDLYGSSGSGFYNLTGYFAAWYATGIQPKITHDVLYYFYRKQPVGADAPHAGKKTLTAVPRIPGVDKIELLAFLTDPGTLSISIDGRTFTEEVKAGVQSFTAPLAAGRPSFSLIRGGATVVSFEGDVPVAGPRGLPTGFADLTYWTGSASSDATCTASDLIKQLPQKD